MLTPEKVKMIIKEIGLTQYKISDACSIPQSMMSMWLNNSRDLPICKVNEIETWLRSHLSKFESLMNS